jgi:hypothetical protein
MSVQLLGVRHHGPGSARNVKAFLEKTRPDVILVEGPPEADDLLQWFSHQELKPPVAILAYRPDVPEKAVFYPFAEFSPEWQAILFGITNKIPVRFIDLPLTHKFLLEPVKNESDHLSNAEVSIEAIKNPIQQLAEAAGYTDGEQWWEHMFEQRVNNEGVFEAVQEAMDSLRADLPEKGDRVERLREAHMRKMIRQAEKENFQNIAVICGAWHAPALANMPKQKEDNDLLKGLEKVKVETTWIPWTYNRLTFASGYGAGIQSPGWYHHLWHHPNDRGTLWMSKVAQLFRGKQMDTSTAHIIEAVRLSEALAALRVISRPGLEELNEATWSVLCNGESILMDLIRDELIVSDLIGSVPAVVPKPPLLQDVERTQKKLRLPAEAGIRELTLDLREQNQLDKSILLHRLLLLEVTWGHKTQVRSKGTFKEQWQLKWEPEYSIKIIEKGNWGNTLEEATTNYVVHCSNEAKSLEVVCKLLEDVIPADLPKATGSLVHHLDNLAAATNDILQLLQALPSLVNVSRYGNVRNTDETLILQIVNAMVARVCISLPAACVSIDDEASRVITEHIFQLNESILLLNQQEQGEEWYKTLHQICQSTNSSPLIAGYCTRLLSDGKVIDQNELTKRFHFALSTASNSSIAAAWVEGFLKGSGTILLLDDHLWNLVHEWVGSLTDDDFVALLPLMRRTFSQFTNAERRKLGEKAKKGKANVSSQESLQEELLDHTRAANALPVVMKLLGLKKKEDATG